MKYSVVSYPSWHHLAIRVADMHTVGCWQCRQDIPESLVAVHFGDHLDRNNSNNMFGWYIWQDPRHRGT